MDWGYSVANGLYKATLAALGYGTWYLYSEVTDMNNLGAAVIVVILFCAPDLTSRDD